MISPTTASYLAKSYASDRDLEAARDRRVALAKQAGQPDSRHAGIAATVSRFLSARLHRPLRVAPAAR